MQTKTCDCLIVGGGPAGATLAGLLANWGRQAVLVHDGRGRPGMPEETMLPGAARILERCGLTALIAEHRFFGQAHHGVRWEEDRIIWTSRPEADRGFQVERRIFDPALRNWARGQGAVVLDGHRVLDRLGGEDQSVVRVQGKDGEPWNLLARTIVVATGRNQTALLDVEVEATGRETVAVSMMGEGPDAMDASVIEAVPEGWLWWLPLRGGKVCLSAFLDGQEYRDAGRELLRSAHAHAKGPALNLKNGRLAYAAKGTPRLLRASALLVGDAASTLDPLSSQGIEKALCSAEAGACAVNTILDTPALYQRIVEHHRAWERGLWHAHARDTAAFYSRQPRYSQAPFWRARRAVAKDAHESPALPPRLRLHPHLLRRPALHRKGRYLVEEPGFALPGSSETLGRLGPVPLAPLVELLGTPQDLSGILRGAAQRNELYPLPPRAVQEAVDELYRRGLFIADERESR